MFGWPIPRLGDGPGPGSVDHRERTLPRSQPLQGTATITMQRLLNLPLAARLGAGFGALGLALVIVAFFAGSSIGSLKSEINELGSHDVRALSLVSNIGTRYESMGHLTAQHLYVHDGDIAAQKTLEAAINALKAANARDLAELTPLLDSPEAKAAIGNVDHARAEFKAQDAEALRRSHSETLAGAEDRAGSRDLYISKVVPSLEQLQKDFASLGEAVKKGAAESTSSSEAKARDGLRTIVIITG